MTEKVPPSKGTVRTVRQKRTKESTPNPDLSSTMQIPLDAIFDDLTPGKSSFIEISSPNESPRRITLSGKSITIGRDSSCDLPLALTNVSRTHATLTCNGEEYVIEDNDSTNGTFVNNIRISRCILRNHDQIRIGEARILFVDQKTYDHT